jgi:hypothetical protein
VRLLGSLWLAGSMGIQLAHGPHASRIALAARRSQSAHSGETCHAPRVDLKLPPKLGHPDPPLPVRLPLCSLSFVKRSGSCAVSAHGSSARLGPLERAACAERSVRPLFGSRRSETDRVETPKVQTKGLLLVFAVRPCAQGGAVRLARCEHLGRSRGNLAVDHPAAALLHARATIVAACASGPQECGTHNDQTSVGGVHHVRARALETWASPRESRALASRTW